MRDFHAFKQTAVRYWERRRIIYNLALVPPAFFGYGFTDTLNWVGDPHQTHYSFILPLFAVSAVGANICYSVSYALEFLFGSDDPSSRWLRFGRTTAFVGGVLFAMLLALIGGRNIAEMDWHHGIKHDQNKNGVLAGGTYAFAKIAMPNPFQAFSAAIIDDNRAKVKELLDSDAVLIQRGVTEEERYESRIAHWIYAGDTVLHVAAAGYRVEIARMLLAAGADPASARNRRCSQPLHYASDGYLDSPSWNASRQVAMIRLLLKAGSNIDAQDKNGRHPSTARCVPDVPPP